MNALKVVLAAALLSSSAAAAAAAPNPSVPEKVTRFRPLPRFFEVRGTTAKAARWWQRSPSHRCSI